MRFRCHRKRTDRLASTLPSTVHTKVQNWENWKLWRKLDSRRMLQTHAPAIFSVIVSILMRFRPSTQKRYVRLFVNLCAFYERFQIDAFSIKTLSDLVRTGGLNASKCMRKRKTSTKCNENALVSSCIAFQLVGPSYKHFQKKQIMTNQGLTISPPPSPQKSCVTWFLLSLGTTVIPRRRWEKSLCKIWGVHNVHFETVTFNTYFFVIFLLNALGISGVCV